MADTTFRFRVDDSNVESAMESLANQVEATDKEFRQLEKDATDALQTIAKNTEETNQTINHYANTLDKTAKKTKEAKEETGSLSRGLKNLFGNISVGGVSLNDLSDGLQRAKEGFNDVKNSGQGAASGAQSAAKGFGVLRLGAFALVAVVGAALVAAFSKFQGNLDKVRVGLAQGKIALDIGITALGKWGNQLIQAATGQKSLRDAVRDAAAETADFNIQIRQQIALEGKLETQRIGLERQKQEQSATASLRKQEIEQLNLIADNTTKSFAVREAAAKKRGALSEQQAKADQQRILTEIGLNARISGGQEQQIKSSKQIVALSKEGTLTTEILAKRIEKSGVSQAEAFKRATQIFTQISELGDAQETLLGIQSEAFNQAQSIRAEQSQAAQAQAQALAEAQKRLQEILKITAEADSEIGGAGRLAAQEFANATAEIVKLQEEYTILANQFKTGETAADIEALFQPLKDIAAGKFSVASFGGALEGLPNALENITKRATNILTGEVGNIVKSDTLKPFNERLREEGLKAGEGLANATKSGVVKGLNAQGLAQVNAEAVKLANQLGEAALQGFFASEDARFELQIARADAQITKISEKVDATRQALNEEEKLQESGYANNVAALKKQLAAEEREQRLAEDKKLDIERKAAKQRAIIAAGEQAVQLVLAATRLAADGAKGGLVGLVLALGGLGILFRIISAARTQAASEASKTAAYATGTDYVEGAGTGTSDSVRARLSRGERVVTAKDNEVLGGRKMSNKDLVRYAMLGQRIKTDPLFAFSMALSGRQSTLEESKLNMQADAMREGFKEAAIYAADKQIGYWKTRPVEYRNEAGEMVREWVEGNRVVRQIEPENNPE